MEAKNIFKNWNIDFFFIAWWEASSCISQLLDHHQFKTQPLLAEKQDQKPSAIFHCSLQTLILSLVGEKTAFCKYQMFKF